MWELDLQRMLSTEDTFELCLLEKTLESPLDCKEVQTVHHKGNQSWVFIGRTDAKAEIPVLWPPHAKSWLIGKGSDAGRDWGQEEKGMTEHEIVIWHHWLNGHEFEQTLGGSEGEGSLAYCRSWVTKSRTWLNNWTTTATKICMYWIDSLCQFWVR